MHGILRDYKVTSEVEKGNGRVDLTLMPTREGIVPILMELKTSDSESGLDSDAQFAIEQIHDRSYYLEIKGKVILIGLSFYGKIVKGKCEILML